MYTIAIPFSFADIVILQLGAIVLGVAIHFFLVSRKTLRQTIAPEKKKKPQSSPREFLPFEDDLPFAAPPTAAKPKKSKPEPDEQLMPPPIKSRVAKDTVIDSFKETVLQQQKSLSSFLHNIESLQSEEYLQLQKENTALKKTIGQFETMLEKQEAELEGAKQQAALAQKMASRIEEVHKEFDYLQTKIVDLEKQSRQANALAMELEDVKQAYEQLNKEVLRKQGKLEEVIAENQRLHFKLSETEDKLTEANFQRQQLAKKAQLMQEMNTDMQQMAETNKKLQTELRRIGELESMLNTIEEERASLLKRSFKK